VDNAAKFSPAESSISVGVRADEGWVTIEVTDEGPGIPTEQREAVFEKFTTWRPDGYETAAGSGLGLFMVRGIVQAHNGTIDIAEVAGDGGTMLRVRLPMEE
jgi:two-component system sensor histidine kinase KdpD